MTSTKLGHVSDLSQPDNSVDNYSIIHLMDKDPEELERKYKDIRGPHRLISAYSMGSKYVFVVEVSGKVIKKIIKRKSKILGE